VEISLALAFAAGVVSFLTPCVLALVPVYLAFLAEATVSLPASDGAAGGGGAGVAMAAPARQSSAVFAQAALFSLGFGIVFVALGISVGLLGAALFREPLVRQLVGVAVIIVGVLMTGVAGPVLDRLPNPAQGTAATTLPSGRVARAIGLGALVAVGWTPCIGPVLGAILAMGASTQDVAVAAVLLVAYSVGLAVPFLVAAAFLPRVHPLLRWLRAHERAIRVVSGLAVAGVGVLIVLDAFTRLAGVFGQFFL
jgi:cytochrome c-type biogenesis protein